MRPMTAPRDWTLAQRFAIGEGLFITVTALIGFAINPSFAVGDDATAKTFIVDWNGWHAVSAIGIGLPGLAIAWFGEYAVAYLAAIAIGNFATGIWAAVDDHPLGVLYFPTNSDAILHVAVAAVAALGALLALRQTRYSGLG